MKKLALVNLFFALSIINTQAMASQHNTPLDKLTEQSFFNDTKIGVTLRNYGKYLNEDGTGDTLIHSAWGQAFGLAYQSGYFADFIGFDASYVNVVKLAASNYFATRNLLWNDGTGYDKKNAHGFDKVSQRYIKIKFGEQASLNFKAKWGWQVLRNYAVLTTSYQLTKNSYLGYSGTLAYDNYSLDTLYVTSSMNRDSPEKEQIQTANKKKIDYIIGTGLNYKDKKLSVTYAYGEADDYIRRQLLELNYNPHPQLTLGSQIYFNNPLTNYKQLSPDKRAADGNSWYYAADIKWQQDLVGLKLGIAHTKADKDNGSLGYFERHVTKNARWRFNSLTEAAYHYQRNGELAITFLGDYQASPNFTTAMQINYGQFNYKDNKFKTGEINVWGQWTPSDSRLKNLSIFAKIGKSWTYKANKAQPIFDNQGHYQRGTGISGEFIIDYRFNLF
ncbi:hypothetical protein RHO12_10965 [Orbus sturtevantii]|uniref:porin n=1 Tax=Orbus sturtevantii TaxID=3074109 RepID=UPI00370D9C5E